MSVVCFLLSRLCCLLGGMFCEIGLIREFGLNVSVEYVLCSEQNKYLKKSVPNYLYLIFLLTSLFVQSADLHIISTSVQIMYMAMKILY